jgi:lysozyme
VTDTGRAALIAALIVAGAAVYVLRDGALGIDAGWVDAAPENDYAPDLADYGNQVTEQVQGIFEGTDEMTRNSNLNAFLLAIRPGEGTSGPDGYRTLFGGDLFGSFDTHPALAGWPGVRLRDDLCANAGFGPGCVSTAAGAYQINRPTWARLQRIIGYGDFSPARQDEAAIQLIKEKGALMDIYAGRIEEAVSKCRKVWASLPGAGYGQREVSMAGFLANYNRAGGVLV